MKVTTADTSVIKVKRKGLFPTNDHKEEQAPLVPKMVETRKGKIEIEQAPQTNTEFFDTDYMDDGVDPQATRKEIVESAQDDTKIPPGGLISKLRRLGRIETKGNVIYVNARATTDPSAVDELVNQVFSKYPTFRVYGVHFDGQSLFPISKGVRLRWIIAVRYRRLNTQDSMENL